MTHAPTMLPTLANAIGFQLVWFAAVIGAANGLPWLGPLAALCFAAAVLAWGGRRRQDLALLAVALPMGFALDTLWVRAGLIVFASPWPESVAPPWIVAMWLGFALTLNHSLARLRSLPWLAAALGAAGAPLAYLAAARGFGAVQFVGDPLPALLAVSLAWTLVVPLLLRVGRIHRPDIRAKVAGR